jgi:hypothetical protein
MSMTQPAQAASIDLAHDELIWLLSSLRLPPMIGMPERFFPEALSLETVEARLQAGAASLRARGFVSSDAKTPRLTASSWGCWARMPSRRAPP